MNVKLIRFLAKRPFGLELELGNKLSLEALKPLVESVGSGRGVLVSHHYAQDTNNKHWHIKLDHSCGDIVGDYGCEIASYKADGGVADLHAMARMVERVRDGGANVNDRCGVHVHVEVSDVSWNQMATFVANWIKMEPYICHMVPHNRSNNKYCKFRRFQPWVQDCVRVGTCLTPAAFWDMVKPSNFDDRDRRQALNLCNYADAYSMRRTIEFRFPEATLDPLDVKNWIRFFIHIVEVGRKAMFPSDLSLFDFDSFLANCGLYGREPFLILSPGLRETKKWFLRRVIKHSRSEEFRAKAAQSLAFMTPPNDMRQETAEPIAT